MIDLLFEGGIFFTGPLTVLALAIVILSARKALQLYNDTEESPAVLKRGLNTIVHLGLFSFFMGILGQAIGLFDAMKAIEMMGAVSPAMLAGGLRVSMIVSIYGLLILLGSSILWFCLKLRYDALVAEGEGAA